MIPESFFKTFKDMFESAKSQSHHHFNEDICEYLMKKKSIKKIIL